MKSFIKHCLLFIVLLLTLSTVQAVEIIKWERLPLAIPLQVGQERVIFVDNNVRVGVPSSLAGKLRVQSTGGAIYLLAVEPIAPTRIQLQDAETGALILMDIVANPVANNTPALEPVQIVEGDHTPVRYGRPEQLSTPETQNKTVTNQQKPHRETPLPVVLTRFAAQNLYAPLRTVEAVAGISRVNLDQSLNLQTLLPSQPIKAKAVAAWRLEDHYVTAVILKNTSNQRIVLDPRLLQGDFIAATFQHPDLGPVGDASDTTTLYLVTRKHGLAQSLLPSIGVINAQLNVDVKTGGAHEK